MSRTKIYPICRSDLTQSLYFPVYSEVKCFCLSVHLGFSDYSVLYSAHSEARFFPTCSLLQVSVTEACSCPHLLSPQRDEHALPATSKAHLTSLFISIISTYRSHIRRPFDGTIRRASLEYVLVPTAVSTTRRALSPCDVEGSLDKPVNLDNQHLSQPH